jgi:SAM-dependent methyltransferase
MKERRRKQLAYSDQQPLMLDEASRRAKAEKIVAVIAHFLGRSSLDGLRLLDIGCSAGIITAEFASAGASVFGVDIDEPGMKQAAQRFGDRVRFALTDGERLPVRTGSMDVVVLNQIYEHVLDPPAVVAEIRRVLAPGGIAYLGLGNRLGIMEPHYRLPFLSWLPRRAAHTYVRATKRADSYHEKFRTRPALRKLFGALDCWDYTFTVIAEPERFKATDMVSAATGARIGRLPTAVRSAALALVPTFIWIGAATPGAPAGPPTAIEPRRVRS